MKKVLSILMIMLFMVITLNSQDFIYHKNKIGNGYIIATSKDSVKLHYQIKK